MMKTVVFDFDKTLTYKDSLSELFREYSGPIVKFVYFGLKVLSKIGLISVKKEKLLMIGLLFRYNESRFADACYEQAYSIKLNPIMDKLREYITNGDRVIVLSASAVYLLKEVFKGLTVEILGSEFVVEKGLIRGFKQHPYGEEKLRILSRNGVNHIDIEYFDSRHDKCLMKIADHWCRVQNGVVVEQK